MYPLIEITSVPIEIRMKTTNASLEYTRGTAEMEISRSDKGVDIKSRPIKLQLDTFEPRQGAPAPRSVTPAPQAAQAQQLAQMPQGEQQSAYEATSAYSDQGQIMLNARFGQELLRQNGQGEAAAEPVQQETVVAEQTPDTEWEDGQMEIRYEMDKLNFDWKIDKGEFEFTPGDIELIVEQKPKVTIKYVGKPIYVPRSADPNYEPVDVKA
ncbi:MAG: hypothetical protein E7474_09170 [Ruminococcaceae bacterium]|nr:hypothetical protein [Oscillospiraceae bacterium]